MASDSNSTLKRKLKLPNKVTRRQLWLLQNEAGYSIISETIEYLELSRPADFVRKIEAPFLGDFRKNQITAQLNRIVDLYVDPPSFRDEITARLRNITRSMTTLETDYVWEWAERNL